MMQEEESVNQHSNSCLTRRKKIINRKEDTWDLNPSYRLNKNKSFKKTSIISINYPQPWRTCLQNSWVHFLRSSFSCLSNDCLVKFTTHGFFFSFLVASPMCENLVDLHLFFVSLPFQSSLPINEKTLPLIYKWKYFEN